MIKTFKKEVGMVQDISNIKSMLYCPNNGLFWFANIRVVVISDGHYIDIDSLAKEIDDKYAGENMFQEELTEKIFNDIKNSLESYKAFAVIIVGEHVNPSAIDYDSHAWQSSFVRLRTFMYDCVDEESKKVLFKTIKLCGGRKGWLE